MQALDALRARVFRRKCGTGRCVLHSSPARSIAHDANAEVGDKLTNAGVKLLSLFGTTETGGIMSSLRDFDTDNAWNYLALPSGNNRKFVKLVQHGTSESGVFEVVGMPRRFLVLLLC